MGDYGRGLQEAMMATIIIVAIVTAMASIGLWELAQWLYSNITITWGG